MISVCVATYNGEKYLKEQLDSILQQLSETDELIISDDRSCDNTKKILESFHTDKRIKIIDGPQKGVIKNFENAIRHAKGDIIFLADQDDVWFPNKVAQTKKIFEEDKNSLVVISDLVIVDKDLVPVEDSYFAYRNVQTGFFKNILKNKYIGAGMAFRKELKSAILPFPKAIPMHDMWIGVMAGNRVKLLHEPLTLYRRHGENTSEISTTASFKQQFRWRWALISSIVKRKIFGK